MGQATLNELVGGKKNKWSELLLPRVEPGRRRLVVVACTPAAADLGRISAHALLFSEGSLWAL